MNIWKCNNCGHTQQDPANENELQPTDLLCSNCYCGYYQYIGPVKTNISPKACVKLHII